MYLCMCMRSSERERERERLSKKRKRSNSEIRRSKVTSSKDSFLFAGRLLSGRRIYYSRLFLYVRRRRKHIGCLRRRQTFSYIDRKLGSLSLSLSLLTLMSRLSRARRVRITQVLLKRIMPAITLHTHVRFTRICIYVNDAKYFTSYLAKKEWGEGESESIMYAEAEVPKRKKKKWRKKIHTYCKVELERKNKKKKKKKWS